MVEEQEKEEPQMSEELDKVLTEMKEQNFAIATLIDEELEYLGSGVKGEVPDEMDGILRIENSIEGLVLDGQNALDILRRYKTQVYMKKRGKELNCDIYADDDCTRGRRCYQDNGETNQCPKCQCINCPEADCPPSNRE
tara:strand:- start:1294 stop:1710 length:417 start_codon:yes stop_codon:yes gene_type:complete